ncbi:MAG: glycine cleavage system aminomethyltransferase GcvT [Planctomycetes bacterium]|nr:glycine cleavage system aminomethyltransferase GcvT [Planctomycetota bacterium]
MAKKTPLYDNHVSLGARMVDFSGWDMPVQYPSGIIHEHTATREACGIFDTCHMGEFLFEGPDVAKALNCALAGDFSKLAHGRERYTFITNEEGGVIDDAVVMIFNDTKAWMVVNAGDIEGDFKSVSAALPENIKAANISSATGKIDVQGPRAWELVKELTGTDFRAMPFYSFIETQWDGGWMVLSRSGYTGEPGAEFYVDASRTAKLWDTLLEKGKAYGAEACGLGARDTLRLESGLPLYGHEMTVELNPIQAGFGKFVKLDKPESFPGKEALLKASPESVLVGLEMEGKRVPRSHFPVKKDGVAIGEITSGAPAPTLGKTIALAYVKVGNDAPGSQLEIEIRGKDFPATVVPLPFYSNPAIREKA